MSLKQDIEQKLGVPVKLRAGMPGSLDVYVNGERIYSKAQTGRMPQNAEILSAVEQRKR
ncbi:MAG: Rdx family protein [Terriglobales bacterium]